MGHFMATIGTTTPLTAFDERGITYLVATNARRLPYLTDEGIHYVHYSMTLLQSWSQLLWPALSYTLVPLSFEVATSQQSLF